MNTIPKGHKAFALGTVFCCFMAVIMCIGHPSTAQALDAQKLRRYLSVKSLMGTELVNPIFMFMDRSVSELYVTDRDLNTVFVLDKSLALIFSMGPRQGVEAPVAAIARDGNIYVAMENKSELHVFNYRGELLTMVSAPEGQEFAPGPMDLGPDGNIYAVDKSRGVCYVIDRSDKIVRTIGADADKKGVSGLTGVTAGVDRVYLFTPFSGGRAVLVYGTDGEFLFAFEAILGEGGSLRMPLTGKLDDAGKLWVVDAMAGLSVYDVEGMNIKKIGTFPPEREVIDFPVSVDFDGQGMVYILENGAKSISVFR